MMLMVAVGAACPAAEWPADAAAQVVPTQVPAAFAGDAATLAATSWWAGVVPYQSWSRERVELCERNAFSEGVNASSVVGYREIAVEPAVVDGQAGVLLSTVAWAYASDAGEWQAVASDAEVWAVGDDGWLWVRSAGRWRAQMPAQVVPGDSWLVHDAELGQVLYTVAARDVTSPDGSTGCLLITTRSSDAVDACRVDFDGTVVSSGSGQIYWLPGRGVVASTFRLQVDTDALIDGVDVRTQVVRWVVEERSLTAPAPRAVRLLYGA
ncbi:MAG: hypothetical protein ACYTF0_04010 [Planctomycetota bacterium]